jgi:hypothetical protein
MAFLKLHSQQLLEVERFQNETSEILFENLPYLFLEQLNLCFLEKPF